MCGISGIVYWDGREPSRDHVDALWQAQCHRGPDGNGVWAGPGVALAHNRLAIIDLHSGQQPMAWHDGRFVITYNGELYNFRELRRELEADGAVFRTSSDTEVVLAGYEKWGEGCVDRFRGMYAFAIWDNARRSLLLARDRAGIKPLYYCQTGESIAFSSELQGLLALAGVPRELDYGSLDLYLHYQYVPAPRTIFAGVRKLAPAHTLLLTAATRQAAPRRYWRPRFEPDHSKPEGYWQDALHHQLADAVRCHLVSDVPFGAFLSGGVDSSVVAFHMSQSLERPVKAFTIGFDETAYDEREHATRVARRIGADHHCEVVRVDKYDLLDDLLPKLVRHYGEPFADSSAIPTYCVSAVARRHVKMVLSGDGGDELFAGYNTYPAIIGALNGNQSLVQRLAAPFRRGRGLRERALGPPRTDALAVHGRVYAYFADEQRRALYRPEVRQGVARSDAASHFADVFAEAGAPDLLSALQYLDLQTYLPGDILTKVDVASMYSSLEVRVPLLDHHVIDLAGRIPARFKLFAADGSLHPKHLLKRHAAAILPGVDFDRPKQGFGVPIARWFGAELYQQVVDRLGDPGGLVSRLFDPARVADLTASPGAAGAHAPRVWSLLFLNAWGKQWGVS
jgi:asparagine synthase (glutamine-hydrolysing)